MGVQIPYKRDLQFEYGSCDQISPGIRRVIANNPSPFTFHGTGTYILGQGDVAVIDPGPADPEHIKAILQATQGETITHILVTHTHTDHSPGCRLLTQHCDAKTYAYGPHGAGKLEEGVQVEEGGDMEFEPDVKVSDGQILQGTSWQVECVYTPGHTSNHMCYQLVGEGALFTGDHVMGWSTTIVSPPDGDMAAYMQSLEKLLQRNDSVYWPTHGPAITEPQDFVKAYIAHREEREAQLLACIDEGYELIEEMIPVMYTDTPKYMFPAAARSALAGIEYLVKRGVLQVDGDVSMKARYRRNA